MPPLDGEAWNPAELADIVRHESRIDRPRVTGGYRGLCLARAGLPSPRSQR